VSAKKKVNDALLEAAASGDLDALRKALKEGGQAHWEGSCALRRAAEEGHVECVRLLIPLSDPMASSCAALRRAAENDHVECVRLLIPVSDASAGDCYALRWAASEGYVECVRLLLPESGALALKGGVLSFSSLARGNGHMEVAGMIEAFIEARALSGGTENPKRSPRAKSSL
jgi:hypothetical protein